MLQKLTHEEWWTDTSIVTDENGAAALDVFKGDYVISVDGKEQKISFSEDGETVLKQGVNY